MTVTRPSKRKIAQYADEFGFDFDEQDCTEFEEQIDAWMSSFDVLEARSDPAPAVSVPRTPGQKADRNTNRADNGWYVRTSIKSVREGALAGKKVALKDNICLAGVPMANGASALEGFVPDVDATVVTRILDAGGEIAGKAASEYFSYSGGSHTSVVAPIHNPAKEGHTSGGSSSGSAAVVAQGDVDMALGADQGGSIRIPASFCGIVGLKPTYGLVPYTGIQSSDYFIDHVGPMSRTVADCALLLSVIAGEDGIDPRQSPRASVDYLKALQSPPTDLKIGVLSEGFGHTFSDPQVDACVRSAIQRLGDAGHVLSEVSVPDHWEIGPHLWMPIGTEGYYMNSIVGAGYGYGHGGLYMASLSNRLRGWRAFAHDFSPEFKLAILIGRHMNERYSGHYYGKAVNLARQLRGAYDAALMEVDLLVLPTLPTTAPKLHDYKQGAFASSPGFYFNVAPFNLTKHPALTMPCGTDENGLPIGIMFVAPHFEEAKIFAIASQLEAALADN